MSTPESGLLLLPALPYWLCSLLRPPELHLHKGFLLVFPRNSGSIQTLPTLFSIDQITPSISPLIIFNFLIFMYLGVFFLLVCFMYALSACQKRALKAFINGYDPPHGCWELNSTPGEVGGGQVSALNCRTISPLLAHRLSRPLSLLSKASSQLTNLLSPIPI